MMRFRVYSIILAALLSHSGAIAQAEPAIDHLPEDALGFVLIRNLEATNAKIERLIEIFQEVSPMPIPAPLPVLQAATGLGEGLNMQGDALLAALPGQNRGDDLRPLLIVAVSDYAAFAASVNGDATGEVCRVTIAEEEILVAKRGTHAVLMNVEHRERLEALLTAEIKPLPALAPLADWLAKIDVAVALTPRGVKLFTAMGQQELAGQRAAVEEQLQSTLQMYETFLGFLGAEMEVAAAGIAIDDQANLKFLSQSLLSKEGVLKDVFASPDAAPLKGFPDQPYVAAVGGPVPPTFSDALAHFMRRIIQADPKPHGFEDFSEQDWQDLEESWRAATKGMRSLAMLFQPGDKDDPLLSHFYAVAKVDDAKAYLDSYKKSMEIWNTLLAKTSSDIKLAYELSDAEVDGKQGVLTTTDVGAAANDGNDPTFNAMMEGALGEDGLLRYLLIPADDATVVFAVSSEDAAAGMITMTVDGESGLADASATQTTVKLLDPKAPWVGLVSPKGTVAWVTRFVDRFLAHLWPGMPAIPEFPESSPVGFSVNLSEGRLSTEMVWPVDTLKSVVAYIKKVQDTF